MLNAIFGSSRSLLCADLDNHVPPKVLERIAIGSGLPEARIEEMTLANYVGNLNNRHTPRGHKFWILPTSPISNDRNRPGLQYCPQCLAEDERPYMRRQWRLGFVTACVKHNMMLRDRCPRCGAFIHQHRSPSLRHCFQCGLDLTKVKTDSPAPEAVAFQSQLEQALAQGWIEVGGKPVYAPLWFGVVRRFCALAVNGVWQARYIEGVTSRYGGDSTPIEKAAPRDPLETLSTPERHHMLDIARRILEDYPNRVIEVCRETRLTRSRVIQDMPYVPFVLDEVLKEYLDDRPYMASEEEVAAVAAYLRRKNKIATYKELKAHCGESRLAIYKHMDYKREQVSPSWWRYAAVAGGEDADLSTRDRREIVLRELESDIDQKGLNPCRIAQANDH
jgi:uncharacterized protein (DUF983 family)